MRTQPDDLSVIQAILQGQHSAYAVLVERYQQYVFTLALRYVPSREVAEELAQDVFVKAYRCLADFKGSSKFSTWLYTIVHTTCLSYLRGRKDNTLLPGAEKMLAIADTNSSEKPAATLEHKTQRQLLEAALTHLPAADAQLLTLFYQAEQSVEEVCIIMGLTAGNVKVRLFRARQKLKEVLETKYSGELL